MYGGGSYIYTKEKLKRTGRESKATNKKKVFFIPLLAIFHAQNFLLSQKLGDFYLLKEIECDECMLNGKILNCCLFTNGNIELRNCSYSTGWIYFQEDGNENTEKKVFMPFYLLFILREVIPNQEENFASALFLQR